MKKKTVFKVMLPVVLVIVFAFFYGGRGETDSVWSELEISFIGDSITEQGFFEHREYPSVVDDNLNFKNVNNYGEGGSSLSIRNDEFDELYPPLVSRWEEVAESDIFFILIGTNDYSSQVPFGNVNSLNPDEFNGSLNIVLSGLKDKYPDSQIIISTILKRKDNDVPIPVTDYNEVIQMKAAEYELVLFDGYNIEGLDIGNDHDGETTDDRLHPNKNGAKIIGEAVTEFFIENKELLVQ